MFKATIVHVLVEETGWESANRTVMFCQHLWVLLGLLGTSRTASHISCNKSRLPAPLQIRTLRLREVQVLFTADSTQLVPLGWAPKRQVS